MDHCLAKAIVLLENVARLSTAALVAKPLRDLGYVTRAYILNSASFGNCQSRTRLFVVGVCAGKVEIKRDPDTWESQLKACTGCEILT